MREMRYNENELRKVQGKLHGPSEGAGVFIGTIADNGAVLFTKKVEIGWVKKLLRCSLRGRRLKGKGKEETQNARDAPRVSLAPKTPFPKTPFPFPFKRLPRRLLRWEGII